MNEALRIFFFLRKLVFLFIVVNVIIIIVIIIISSRKRMTSYRPWGSLEDGAIEFESLTTERLEGAMEVIRQDFFTGENVCIAVKLQEEPGAAAELEQLCFNAIKDGVSVVAIDVMAGEVVGVALNKIQV